MDTFSSLLSGFEHVLTWKSLLYSLLGVTLGNFVGVLPGLGPLAAISLLLPLIYGLDPASALIVLAGIYYGSQYGGATTSILLNIPGDASGAMTCLDGYPLARKGRAGVAIFTSMYGSFIGGVIGILAMMFLSPLLVKAALSFQAAEYFAIMAFGMIAAATLSSGDVLKGLAMIVLGILLGCIGLDVYSGLPRLTFGSLNLIEGVPLGVLAIGLFGIGELLQNINQPSASQVAPGQRITLRSLFPTLREFVACTKPVMRGSMVGALLGALPGTGATLASFMAYGLERRVSKHPERFGHGAIEGVAAPESANNASAQTAFIPTLTLGIPGSATMALVLGAMTIFNIAPGPRFPVEHPDVFWTLIASFWLGNVMLMVLNLPLIGFWVRILRIPYEILYPVILFFVCIGVYGINNSLFDVGGALVFGLLGYMMSLLGFPTAPLILGFVLGPMMEETLRRAMLYAHGDPLRLLERPLAGTFLVLSAALLLWSLYSGLRSKQATTGEIA